MKLRFAALLAAVVLGPLAAADEPRILVFSKTLGFRHDSIETGVQAIRAIGDKPPDYDKVPPAAARSDQSPARAK